MTQAKYVKVAGVWEPVIAEYAKIGGAWKLATANRVKIGGVWKDIPVGAKYIFACEQFSDYLYGLDDTPTDLAGWPKFGVDQYPPAVPAQWETITDPNDVAVDNDGNSYWACSNGVYKIGLDGTIAWRNDDHASTVLSICVDADGYVYSGDFLGVVKKLSPAGAEVWTKTLGASYSVYALAVDYSAGRLYAGTGNAHNGVYSIVTLNGNATSIYTSPYGDVSGIAIDEGSPTSLYIGTNGGYLMKITLAGYVYWGDGGAISTGVYNVRVGHDGYGYCATGPSGGLYKFNLSTGANTWHYIPGGTACAIGCAVDMFGNVYGTWYVAGVSVRNIVRKVNSAGSLVWSYQPYESAQWMGIAVTPGIKAAGW